MEYSRAGSQPSKPTAKENFTGSARLEPLFSPDGPARVKGGAVTFEPGARTNWHTHPYGQALIVTAGCGRVQAEGKPIQEIRPGDVVWIAPGEKHWHGAGDTTPMTHIAVSEHKDGVSAEWLEPVTDEQYRGGL